MDDNIVRKSTRKRNPPTRLKDFDCEELQLQHSKKNKKDSSVCNLKVKSDMIKPNTKLDDITDSLAKTTQKSVPTKTKSSEFQEEINIQCAICGIIFETGTILDLHITNKHTKYAVHEEKKPKKHLKAELMCPFCQEEFTGKTQFKIHISKSQNGKCPTVQEIEIIENSMKKFDQTSLEEGSDIEEHLISEKKNFQCIICDKKFSSKVCSL